MDIHPCMLTALLMQEPSACGMFLNMSNGNACFLLNRDRCHQPGRHRLLKCLPYCRDIACAPGHYPATHTERTMVFIRIELWKRIKRMRGLRTTERENCEAFLSTEAGHVKHSIARSMHKPMNEIRGGMN